MFYRIFILKSELLSCIFQKYSWTGQNTFFIKGNAESLSIGAGEYVPVQSVPVFYIYANLSAHTKNSQNICLLVYPFVIVQLTNFFIKYIYFLPCIMHFILRTVCIANVNIAQL